MMQIAAQNGAAIIVRDLDYQSKCCCGLPCVAWERWARRFSDGIYRNSPPPTFPCCGMLEAYSVGGGVFSWVRQDLEYMLVGNISVFARSTGSWSEFSGVYDGFGGFLYVRDQRSGSDFTPYLGGLQHTAYARLYVGKAPLFNPSGYAGRCLSELWVGVAGAIGNVLVTTVGFLVSVSDRGQLNPSGFYAAAGNDDTVLDSTGLTVS